MHLETGPDPNFEEHEDSRIRGESNQREGITRGGSRNRSGYAGVNGPVPRENSSSPPRDGAPSINRDAGGDRDVGFLFPGTTQPTSDACTNGVLMGGGGTGGTPSIPPTLPTARNSRPNTPDYSHLTTPRPYKRRYGMQGDVPEDDAADEAPSGSLSALNPTSPQGSPNNGET